MFDVVVSSGMIEHIGIVEKKSPVYVSARTPSCHALRQRFIDNIVRVLKKDGFILLDHPNGSFPVDFWHGGHVGGTLRFHWPINDMLPRFSEVREYFQTVDKSFRLYSLSVRNRLRLVQVQHHWYGKLFAVPMRAWLNLLGWKPFGFLRRSFLCPYLVTVATRDSKAENWIF